MAETEREPKVSEDVGEKREFKKRRRNPNKKDVDHYRELDRKYKDILDKLVRVDIESDAVPIIKEEAKTGRITKAEIEVVIQRYKAMRRRMADAAQLRKLVIFDGSLEELKGMVNTLVKKRKIQRDQAADIITKWKTRERRRTGRKNDKMNNISCLLCRQKGHKIADCPEKSNANDGDTDHCFKCGAMDHNIYSCPKKHVKGFPFAVCFICNGDGHLSRDCEQNKQGVYPDGGSCDLCSSIKHLKKDCPELRPKKEVAVKNVFAQPMSAMSNLDDDFEGTREESPRKKKAKVIKF
ncbi:unnamed protein product [Auanema sp. JU1783]|nr:unnamed protein product [Auanema sp. JU1783]